MLRIDFLNVTRLDFFLIFSETLISELSDRNLYCGMIKIDNIIKLNGCFGMIYEKEGDIWEEMDKKRGNIIIYRMIGIEKKLDEFCFRKMRHCDRIKAIGKY